MQIQYTSAISKVTVYTLNTFWSGALDELERLQEFVSMQEIELMELSRDDTEQRFKIETRLNEYKDKIIKLSSTTKLLSPLTAFVGMKKDGKKERV